MSNALEVSVLLRLLETGTGRGGVRNLHLYQRLQTARWIDPSGRKNEWSARADALLQIEERLTALMPNWREDAALLRTLGRDPYDPSDIDALPMLRRQIDISGRMVNRRTWNAAVGLGPKHTAKLKTPAVQTKDWVLRFRPNKGLQGTRGTDTIDFSHVAAAETECTYPERAWMAFNAITGIEPRVMVSCENLGAYVDMEIPDDVLLVYSPGADCDAAVALLSLLPMVPWIHFGDIDPEGIAISHQIGKRLGREAKILIPSFAEDYLDASQPTLTPWRDSGQHPVLMELKKRQKRIFQEVFVLDERLRREF